MPPNPGKQGFRILVFIFDWCCFAGPTTKSRTPPPKKKTKGKKQITKQKHRTKLKTMKKSFVL